MDLLAQKLILPVNISRCVVDKLKYSCTRRPASVLTPTSYPRLHEFNEAQRAYIFVALVKGISVSPYSPWCSPTCDWAVELVVWTMGDMESASAKPLCRKGNSRSGSCDRFLLKSFNEEQTVEIHPSSVFQETPMKRFVGLLERMPVSGATTEL